jgi:hypothetical protein
MVLAIHTSMPNHTNQWNDGATSHPIKTENNLSIRITTTTHGITFRSCKMSLLELNASAQPQVELAQ